jgi:hypothetical protein
LERFFLKLIGLINRKILEERFKTVIDFNGNFIGRVSAAFKFSFCNEKRRFQ